VNAPDAGPITLPGSPLRFFAASGDGVVETTSGSTMRRRRC
jgi:hypothetical protein